MSHHPLGRRTFLTGAAALAAAGALHVKESRAQEPVPNSSGMEAPKLKAPVGACDCHHHIYDAVRFPPPQATVPVQRNARVEEYRLLQRRIGTTRDVVVTPSAYVTDNRVTLDAIAQLGRNARGVAVISPDVADAELKTLNDGGIRGIRFSLAVANGTASPLPATTIDAIESLGKRVNALGWHVQFNVTADQIVAAEDLLNRLPAQIVFDHMGIGPPTYADVNKVGAAYVQAAPERMLWGSNWPHPNETTKPDDAMLFDLLTAWAPREATRRRILVENPETLYGFAKIG